MRLAIRCIGTLAVLASLLACSPSSVTEAPAEQSVEIPASQSASTPPPPPEVPPPAPPEPPAPPPDPVLPPQETVDPQPEGTIPVDEAALSAAEAVPAAADLWFETAESVDSVSYGIVGDGKTDNTDAFRRLLAAGNRTIYVPAGDYVTDKLELAAYTALVLEAGVTIRDAGRLGRMDRLLNIRTNNVRISGLGARIVANRQHYTTDEWRHGVYIYAAHRVLIEGLESSSHGGDGFYIGGPTGNPSTDVLLKGCKADNNRRQGLSITSARTVRIVDCEFTATNGTAPQFGIDLEPNNATDVLDRIAIVRTQTARNRGGGIMVWLQELDASSLPVDVTVLDHASQDEAPRIFVAVPRDVSAGVRYRAWK